MKTLKLVAAIAALTGSMSASAANIDLFTDPAGETLVRDSNTGPGFDPSTGLALTSFIESSDSGSGSILGGFRDMEVDFISLDTSVFSSGAANLAVSQTPGGEGRLTFNSTDGVIAKGIVQWDGFDASSTLTTGAGGLDEDITDGGVSDRFIFDVISADQDFNFSIGLYDTDGSSVVFDLPANLGPHSSAIEFSLFNAAFIGGPASLCATGGPIVGLINSVSCTAGTTAGIDFTHIRAMELILNTSGLAGQTVSLDMTIGGIKTVPEPSSVALIGLGLIASGFAGKRKSKKA